MQKNEQFLKKILIKTTANIQSDKKNSNTKLLFRIDYLTSLLVIDASIGANF